MHVRTTWDALKILISGLIPDQLREFLSLDSRHQYLKKNLPMAVFLLTWPIPVFHRDFLTPRPHKSFYHKCVTLDDLLLFSGSQFLHLHDDVFLIFRILHWEKLRPMLLFFPFYLASWFQKLLWLLSYAFLLGMWHCSALVRRLFLPAQKHHKDFQTPSLASHTFII